MGLTEEVKIMQKEGRTDDEIIRELRERGVPYREIAEALSQSKIKAAVEAPPIESETPPYPTPEQYQPQQAPQPYPDQGQYQYSNQGYNDQYQDQEQYAN